MRWTGTAPDDLMPLEPCNCVLIANWAKVLLAIVGTLECLDGADQPDHQRPGKQQQTGQGDDLEDVPDGIGVAAGAQSSASGITRLKKVNTSSGDQRGTTNQPYASR